MKTLVLLSAATLSALIATPAFAQTTDRLEVSGSLTVASDYRFRGISQTDRSAAIQGALHADYAVSEDWTVFGSVWASNLDFTDAELEIDFTAGATRNVGPGTFTVSGVLYTYPGADEALEYDYAELGAVYAQAAGPGTVTAGVLWSPDFFGGSGTALYGWARGDLPVSDRVSLFLEAGHQTIEENASYGVPDYWTWQAGAAFTFGRATVSAAWVDTELDDAQCSGDLCEGTVLASLSIAF